MIHFLSPHAYRLAVYCAVHSGVKFLTVREKIDCTSVNDIVNKESWRESNAYHKVKPTLKDAEKRSGDSRENAQQYSPRGLSDSDSVPDSVSR